MPRALKVLYISLIVVFVVGVLMRVGVYYKQRDFISTAISQLPEFTAEECSMRKGKVIHTYWKQSIYFQPDVLGVVDAPKSSYVCIEDR